MRIITSIYSTCAFLILSVTVIFGQTPITEYYDLDGNLLPNAKNAHRVVTGYLNENGEPVGKSLSHLMTGELMAELEYSTDEPGTFNGKQVWYFSNGQEEEISYYVNDIPVKDPIYFNPDGDTLFNAYHETKAFLTDLRTEYPSAGKNRRTATMLIDIADSVLTMGGADREIALFFYATACDLYSEIKSPKGHGEALQKLGDYHYMSNSLEQARKCYGKIFRLNKKHWPKKMFFLYYAMGDIAYKLGYTSDAIDKFQRALKHRDEQVNGIFLCLIYSRIADLTQNPNDLKAVFREFNYHKGKLIAEKELPRAINLINSGVTWALASDQDSIAKVWLNESLGLCEIADDPRSYSKTYWSWGHFHYIHQNFTDALSFFLRAEKLAQTLPPDPLFKGRLYQSMGETYANLDNQDSAQYFLRKGMSLMGEVPIQALSEESVSGMSNASFAIDRNDQVIRWLLLQKESKLKSGDIRELIMVLHQLGMVYLDMGMLPEAFQEYAYALDLCAQLEFGDLRLLNLIGLGMARVEMGLGNIEQAKEVLLFLERKLEVSQDSAQAIRILELVGTCYYSIEQYDSAIYWYEKAIQTANDQNYPTEVLHVQTFLGVSKYRSGQVSEAFQLFEELEPQINNLSDNCPPDKRNELIISFHYHFARLLMLEGKNDEAYRHLQRSIAQIESTRNPQKGYIFDSNMENISLQVYGIAAVGALEKGDSKTGFQYLEATRSRQYLDLLFESTQPGKQEPDELLVKQLSQVEAQIRQKERLIEGNLADSLKLELQSQLRDLNRLRRALTSQNKNQGNLWKPIGLEEVQRILRADEVLVEYFYLDSAKYAFVVSDSTFQLIPIDPQNTGHTALLNFLNVEILEMEKAGDKLDLRLLSKQKERMSQWGPQLYQELWAPIEASGMIRKGSKIILVPHGSLIFFPFETLYMDTSKIHASELNYLGDQNEIAYYPSASIFYYQRLIQDKNSHDIPASLYAIAVEDIPPSHCASHELGQPLHLDQGAPFLNWLSDSLSQSVPVKVRKPMEATESGVKEDALGSFSYLYFHTHGIANNHSFLSNKLIFKKDDQNNGCLEIHEIFELDLNAQLVILAACQSALGVASSGEGIQGFAQALQYAGARELILSLWSVNEEATVVFFKAFFKALFNDPERNTSLALRAARKEMRTSKRWNNPYYWAGFVLYGGG